MPGLMDFITGQQPDPQAEVNPNNGLLGLFNQDQSQGLMNIATILSGIGSGRGFDLAGVKLQQNTLSEARAKREKKRKLALAYADKVSDPEIADMLRSNPDLIDEIMGKQVTAELDPNTQFAKSLLGTTDTKGGFPMEVLDKVRAAAKIPDLTDAEASTLAHASSGGPTGFANALFKITDDRRMMAAKSIKDQEDAKIRAKYHEFFDGTADDFTPENLERLSAATGIENMSAPEASVYRAGLWAGQEVSALKEIATNREQRATDERIRTEQKTDNERQVTALQNSNAMALGREYRQTVEPYTTTINAGRNVLDLVKNQTGISPTQQMTTLYSFIKSLDPNSVVREGEIALYRGIMSYKDRAALIMQRIEDGGVATPEEYKEMQQEVLRIAKLAERSAKAIKKEYKETAAAQGISDIKKIPNFSLGGIDDEAEGSMFDMPEPTDGGWQEIDGVRIRPKAQ